MAAKRNFEFAIDEFYHVFNHGNGDRLKQKGAERGGPYLPFIAFCGIIFKWRLKEILNLQ
ncbi:MAG TPA: hypothetical protein PLH96_02735 [Candidatus Paceibacterota bacterium]|nr:hypothetical protein [Candidatus Paceibacterota bacterium]